MSADLRADARELVDELVELYDDGRTTASLLTRLDELAVPGADPPRDGRPAVGKRAGSPAPVYDPAFDLVTTVEAGARLLEAEARGALGFTERHRPPTREHAVDALRTLPDLLAALPTGHELAHDALERLKSWHNRARTLTGHRMPWPRVPGWACPYCGALSLRLRPRDGAVLCMTPSCAVPGTDARPSWPAEQLAHLGLVLEDASA